MGRIQSYGNDTAGIFTDIDKVLDAFTQAEKAEGVEPTFEEADIKLNGTKDRTSQCDSKTCDKRMCLEKKKKSAWFSGNFDLSLQDYDDDDEDEEQSYICEYCDALGYHQKYKPELCDTCSLCEQCSEYIDESCSGCSYSIYRDGEYYRDKMSESELLPETDLELFQDLNTNHCKRLERTQSIFHRR